MHCAVDDHTRPADAGIHPDETAATCAGVLRAPAAWFDTTDITRIERGMTDTATAHWRSHAWRRASAGLGARPRFTGLVDSSAGRAAAPPGRLHTDGHHRSQTARGGLPPISRTTVSHPAGHFG